MTTYSDPEKIRQALQDLISNFKNELQGRDLRAKVLSLVSCYKYLRELGKSLITEEVKNGGRARILAYFRKYPMIAINGDELLVVSGIQEWARRIRELRVQFGWSIINGITAKQMEEEIENTSGEKSVVKTATRRRAIQL